MSQSARLVGSGAAIWRFTRSTIDFLDGYLNLTRGALRRLKTDGTVRGITSMRVRLSD